MEPTGLPSYRTDYYNCRPIQWQAVFMSLPLKRMGASLRHWVLERKAHSSCKAASVKIQDWERV